MISKRRMSPALTAPRKTLRTLEDLATAGLLSPSPASDLARVADRYALAITPAMTDLIDRTNPSDPIARQFLPDSRELVGSPDEHPDPIGDKVHEKVPGIVHRYPDRVLLKLTHTCPVYCRFCFRREMVGPGNEPPLDDAALERALAYIASDPAIFEVILTGGDPLILSPRRLGAVTKHLDAIPHVQVIRWHTRVPVVEPERITTELIAALKATNKAVYIGIHTNHARELGDAARAAIGRLADAGLALLSQTVLLKGINDDATTLAALFRALLALRVRPYYLHHMDQAPGTGQFRTTIDEGQAIMRQLRGTLSGLALPTYILDVPGGHGKVPIGPTYLSADTARVDDVSGRSHAYPQPRRDDPDA